MFLELFLALRQAGFKVTMREHLTLLEALEKGIGTFSAGDFYALARAVYVKHESMLDRFDVVFGRYAEGMAALGEEHFRAIPEEWLRKLAERNFSDEEKAMIEAMGGLDALMERFRKLLEEQHERHQGGNRFIGTAGTSPFGAYGYNPEGFRIGQEGSRHRRAVKVWDKREFANLDDSLELNTRNLRMALRKLRVFTREGAADELDLSETIRSTCENAGHLQIEMVPSRKNRAKVLLFLDAGGSMDDHIELCAQFFSAARNEFRHLEYFYFHNCIYDHVWKDNRRRFDEKIPVWDILHKFNGDYRVIIAGDASMSPYEIMSPGGSVEYNNEEAGIVWLERLRSHFPHHAWLNPVPQAHWSYTTSIGMIRDTFGGKMFPLTPGGIGKAARSLRKKVAELPD